MKSLIQKWLGIDSLIQDRDDSATQRQAAMVAHKSAMDEAMHVAELASSTVFDQHGFVKPGKALPTPAAMSVAMQPPGAVSAFPPYSGSDWLACNWLMVVKDSPDQFNIYNVGRDKLFYFYAVDQTSFNDHNVWVNCNLTGLVPPGTKAVFLSGFLMISHGNNGETANLGICLRRDSTVTRGPNYISQCVCALPGDGQRSGFSCWCPLDGNLTFQHKWIALPPSHDPFNYPNFSAFGGNIRVVAAAG